MTTGTIVILVVLGANFVYSVAKHGEEKNHEAQYYNGVSQFLNSLCWILLLWWAGNFG